MARCPPRAARLAALCVLPGLIARAAADAGLRGGGRHLQGLGSSHHEPAGLTPEELSFVDRATAVRMDAALVAKASGFSAEQLTELAGISVACAAMKEYPPDAFPSAVVFVGPGGNGADGLVAAWHMAHYGYQMTVVYPNMGKPSAWHDFHARLLAQLQNLGVKAVDGLDGLSAGDGEKDPATNIAKFDIAVDSMFGYSFSGWRGAGRDEPYDHIVYLLGAQRNPGYGKAGVPVISVDMPSGWDVERGPTEGTQWQPDVLVSLAAPKAGARWFRGARHYLGGRFVSGKMRDEYGLRLPEFAKAEQCVRLPISHAPIPEEHERDGEF